MLYKLFPFKFDLLGWHYWGTKVLPLLCLIAVGFSGAPVFAQSDLVDLTERQNWDAVDQAIATTDNINATQGDGMTALHWASWHGRSVVVDQLLTGKAKVDLKTTYGVTPLSLACERGRDRVVDLLIKAGADVELARLGKERPLMLAARQGNPKVVGSLLEAGAELDAVEAGGQTALMWAAAAGNHQVVDRLIHAGADINIALSQSGFTAFHFAARQGRTKTVLRLIKAGFDINAVMKTTKTGGRKPRKKMSALMLAIESGHLGLALELVELGANPNDLRSGFAPLHAISWIRKTQVGDNPAGDPAPRLTGSVNSLEFVRRMLKAGAKVNLQVKKGKAGKTALNPVGMTPFMYAASTADLPLMELLLEHGADPLITNSDGCTTLMAAAGVGVVFVGEYPGSAEEVDRAVELLVRLGVDLNAVDANGETAMHGAAYRNYPSTVKLLSECGADPSVWNKKNKHGWTPHLIASGKRKGSLKPSPPTLAALDAALAVEIEHAASSD